MKNILTLFLLFVGINFGICQETILRVLGHAKYTEVADKKVIVLNFQNNPEICNPITQNKPLDVQVHEFTEELKKGKIDFQLVRRETPHQNEESDRMYELLLPLTVSDHIITKIINTSGLKIAETYYKFSKNSFSDQDSKAILALQNSQKTAKTIAGHLNYEVFEIINIDDETSDNSEIFEELEMSGLDEEQKAMYILLFLSLSQHEDNTNAIKQGAYSIWVTYRLKHK